MKVILTAQLQLVCRRGQCTNLRAKTYQQRGFTLLELMVTLAVVAILATVAAPSFTSLIKSNQVSSMRDNLASSIKLARSEAVVVKTLVTICASSNQSSCSGNTRWDLGWIIFTDANNDQTVSAGDRLVDVQYAQNGVSIAGGVNFMTFRPSGVKTIAGLVNLGVCDQDAVVDGSTISISSSGAVRYSGAALSGCP